MPSSTTYVLVALLCVACLGFALRAARRWGRDEWIVVGVSLLVGAVTWQLWPTELHLLEGQSFANADIFDGIVPLAAEVPWYLHPPLMRLLAAALACAPGAQVDMLLPVASIVGALLVAAAGLLALRLGAGVVGALLAVALLSIDPQNLLWSHAVYHVVHPAALFTFGVVLLVDSVEATDHRGSVLSAAGGGLFMALAVATRLEFIAFVPVVIAMLRLKGRRWNTPLVPAATVGLLAAGALFATRTPSMGMANYGWSLEAALESVASAAGCLELLAPWLTPVAAIGLGVLLHRQVAALWPVLLAGCVGWIGLASFGDFGARHAFLLRVVAVVLVGRAWSQEPAWPRLGVLLLVTSLGHSAIEMREHYFAAPPSPSVDAIPSVEFDQLLSTGCLLVSHSGTPLRRNRRVDPLELLDPSRARVLWRQHGGCVLWIQGRDDFEWDETVRRSRRDRLEHLWSWDRIGSHARPNDGLRPVLRMRGEVTEPVPRALLLRLLWMIDPPATPRPATSR